jgi:hypothetical protein
MALARRNRRARGRDHRAALCPHRRCQAAAPVLYRGDPPCRPDRARPQRRHAYNHRLQGIAAALGELASELRQDREVDIRVQSENCRNGENGGPGRCERNWREAS